MPLVATRRLAAAYREHTLRTLRVVFTTVYRHAAVTVHLVSSSFRLFPPAGAH